MTRRLAPTLLFLLVTAAARPGAAAAQFAAAQPAAYLLAGDAFDGRAVWLQPAALARHREASVGAHLSADRAAGATRIADYGLTFASNGLALGWQHDNNPGGTDASAYAIGLGLGDARFAAGFNRRWYRQAGRTSGTVDIGLRYQPTPLADFSLVWRDIGDPVVRDTVQRAVVVPGLALNLLRGRLRVGAEMDLVADGWGTSEIRGGLTLVVGPSLVLRTRGTFAPGFERREFAVAAEWSAPQLRLIGFSSARRATDAVRAGMAGLIVARPPTRRFGR